VDQQEEEQAQKRDQEEEEQEEVSTRIATCLAIANPSPIFMILFHVFTQSPP